MKHKNKGFFVLPTSFLDILFNLAMVFLSLLILLLIIMKVEVVKTKIDAQAEFIITMTWPTGDWDMDMWIGTPDGGVVFYQKDESVVLSLERDDTGLLNDKFVVNGEEVINPLNQEIVVIRGIYPGEYVVNVHLYRTGSSEETGYALRDQNGDIVNDGSKIPPPETNPTTLIIPIDVFVKVDKINPTLKTVYATKVHIVKNRQEHHVVRFTINDDGSVGEIILDQPVSLHEKTGLSVELEIAPGEFENTGGTYSDIP